MKLLQPQNRAQTAKLSKRTRCFCSKPSKKLVRFGHKVGVTPEAMISLLDSGLSVRDLLVFLCSIAFGADQPRCDGCGGTFQPLPAGRYRR
jgi:hypothetical protein